MLWTPPEPQTTSKISHGLPRPPPPVDLCYPSSGPPCPPFFTCVSLEIDFEGLVLPASVHPPIVCNTADFPRFLPFFFQLFSTRRGGHLADRRDPTCPCKIVTPFLPIFCIHSLIRRALPPFRGGPFEAFYYALHDFCRALSVTESLVTSLIFFAASSVFSASSVQFALQGEISPCFSSSLF